MFIPLSTKNLDFLEKDSSEKGEGYHDRKDNHERDAGNYGARVAFERKLDNGRTFIHGEFSPFSRDLQIRDGVVKGGKGYTRQRHEPAHMKNAVQEPEKIRVFGNSDNMAHNVRNAFPGYAAKTSTTNHNIDAGLDTNTPGFNAGTSLSQGKIGKGEGLRAKGGGKVNTASSGELHFNNLFCDLCEPLKRLYRNLRMSSMNFSGLSPFLR